ncbi:MAG: YceI family protein [Chloroflexi bacterium]|nr:YceI family protein [Chloroflexota bacterium]
MLGKFRTLIAVLGVGLSIMLSACSAATGEAKPAEVIGTPNAIDLTTLRSGSNRRDGFIRRNTLETDRFPAVDFVITQQHGLPVPLPTAGQVAFQLIGDLTIHRVTRPTTWNVTAQVSGHELKGSASTTFKFGDFGMEVPRAFVVLSVEDKIRLEHDFHFVPSEAASQ